MVYVFRDFSLDTLWVFFWMLKLSPHLEGHVVTMNGKGEKAEVRNEAWWKEGVGGGYN